MHFVEAFFAAMTQITVKAKQEFLFEKGPGGVGILFDKSCLPQPLFRAFASSFEEVNVIHTRDPEN